MSIEFDPGYTSEPYISLCADYESAEYPASAFRLEWGPIFHRGRLDGSARVLVIGQDPATHEDVTRRILVGTAGHRVQGFLGKLGITKRYVMLNTFIFSVSSQSGGASHKHTKSIVDYRNRWFDAVLAPGNVQAVVAFGTLAHDAWTQYVEGASGAAYAALPFQPVLHPTWPESSTAVTHGDLAAAIKHMLEQWNTAIAALLPVVTPDGPLGGGPYGAAFKPEELPAIPAADLPAGLPPWMAGADGWAKRVGVDPAKKRRTLQVVVPDGNI